MNAFVSHPSVRVKGTENNFEPANCVDPKCTKSWPHLHCPFCVKTEFFQDPVILKAHYRVKHVDKGIEFAGLKILRCAEQCDIVGTIKGSKEFKGAHWHCYKCRNGFSRRDEAIKHYRTHFRNPSTTFQIQVTQDINQHGNNLSKEVTTAIDGLPQEMTLIETVVTTAPVEEVLGEKPMTGVAVDQVSNEEPEKSTSGEIQVSVAANETVGTCEGQSVMIVPRQDIVGCIDLENRDDFESLLKQYRNTVKAPVENNSTGTALHWRREKLLLEQQVKEMKTQVSQIQAQKAQVEHQLQEEISSLKSQLQTAAAELEAYQKREAELLNQLKMPLEDRVGGLMENLRQQHEELLHQQLAQLRQAYLQRQYGQDLDVKTAHPLTAATKAESDNPNMEQKQVSVSMARLVHDQSHIMADNSSSTVTLSTEMYRALPAGDNSISHDGIVLSTQPLMDEERHTASLITDGEQATLITDEGHTATQLFVVSSSEQSLQQVKPEELEHENVGSHSDDLGQDYETRVIDVTPQLSYNTGATTEEANLEHEMILIESSTVTDVSTNDEFTQKPELSVTLDAQHIEQPDDITGKRRLDSDPEFDYVRKSKQSKHL